MLPVVLDKPSVTLQCLKLDFVRLKLQPSPDKVFINIFYSPHLKSVCLKSCYIGADGLLPALTQGLRRQMLVGSLEELRLEGNNLSASPDSELQNFFDVIFSLPQLTNLLVDLSYSDFMPHHLSLMHDSWRRNASQSGKRLKFIGIRCRLTSEMKPQFRLSQLQDIAQTADRD